MHVLSMTFCCVIFALTDYGCGFIRVIFHPGLFAWIEKPRLVKQLFEEYIACQDPICFVGIELIEEKRSLIWVKIVRCANNLRSKSGRHHLLIDLVLV